MKIAVYGGSFNPPHLGHEQAVRSVLNCLHPDQLLIMPARVAPHKEMSPDTPPEEERVALCRLAFGGMEGVEISELEMHRTGKSYTSDTIRQLKQLYPGDEILFVMGTDMILSLETWHEPEYILANAQLAVLLRGDPEDEKVRGHIAMLEQKYGVTIQLLNAPVLPAASTDIREALKRGEGNELLSPAVYARIIQNRDYGARANLEWLREQAIQWLNPRRVPHVMGCAGEAVRLAKRWGADPVEAETAGILHDITKKCTVQEQLLLCDKYGMIIDMSVPGIDKTLHQVTGAAVAYGQYGVSEEVRDAIRWHTTGKPDMTLLEKIIYLADYIEPTRNFDGVEPLRKLCYEDIDAAMELGLRMTIEDLQEKNAPVLEISRQAYDWFRTRREG